MRGGRSPILAHRAAYELTYGKILEGLCVLHTCDFTSCVNPSHLKIGTQAENIKDMVQKERHVRGEQAKHHKLTDQDILNIRRQRQEIGITHAALAQQYGVSTPTITNILNGKDWKHLPLHP